MKSIIFVILTLASAAMAAPLSTTTDSGKDKSTTSSPPTTEKLAQNVSTAALSSWQSATILLRHIEEVILAGYEVPPSTPCFQEEREQPGSNTDYQGNIVKDYNSLLSYREYFKLVEAANSEETATSPTGNPSTTTDAIYTIELSDFSASLSVLVAHMESLLAVLEPSALTAKDGGTETTLSPDCFETCYGQQVSALRDYSVLVKNYIPSDIEGIKKS